MPIGVGVVIDDQLTSERDGIGNIVQQLKKANIPIVTYSKRPPESVFAQFGTIAFLLLDWDLSPISVEAKQEGVQTFDSSLCAADINAQLLFIQQFHEHYPAPVFIFSNTDIDDIRKVLDSSRLFKNSGSDFIFLQSKSELKDSIDNQGVVIQAIENWIKSSPVIHLITQWNRSISEAQGKMFSDFSEGSFQWPQVLWKAYKKDGGDPNAELVAMMGKNLFSRIECNFSPAIMEQATSSESTRNELMAFLEKAISIPDSSLEKRHGSGDIFCRGTALGINVQEYPYLLNISCNCDFARNTNFRALFLGGKVISADKVFQGNGALIQPLSRAYVIPIAGNQCLCFEFSQHEIILLSKMNLSGRICRVTAPYLTDIRQRYAHWIQREGLPVYPCDDIQTRS